MTTKGAADKALLEELHNLTASELVRVMKQGGVPARDSEGMLCLDKDGVVIMDPIPAAVLNQVRQFLKDNDVKCAPTTQNPIGKLGELSAARGFNLPFEGDEQGAPH